MGKGIGGFLGSLEAVSEFFKEYQEEEGEFSEHGEEIPVQNHRIIHTEDDSVVKQWRGY